MRILQIVAYISPDGAYGGPVRVAINQAKALTELGHEVIVAAAAGGFEGPLPSHFDGFPVKLFRSVRVLPRTGFAGLTSPGLLSWLTKAITGADVVHIHMARDLVTLPSATFAVMLKKPLVVQAHGMIDPSGKLLAKPLDKFFTIPILKYASHVLYLRREEKQELNQVTGGDLNTHFLPNGTPLPKDLAIEQVTGIQERPEVLYMARLHAIKRPMLMLEASFNLLRLGYTAVFTLAGPDEGEGPKLQSRIARFPAQYAPRMEEPIPPSDTNTRLRRASVYVLPSIDETFPMSVLEAMSIALPVVVTSSCGLAEFVSANNAGIVCGSTSEELQAAMGELIENPKLRISMGQKARQAVADHYSIESVAQSLEDIYANATQNTQA